MAKPISKEQILAMIIDCLPHCPICQDAANYESFLYSTGFFLGPREKVFRCRSCQATWFCDDIASANKIRKLKLIKHGRQKRVKPLLKKEKTIRSWQSLDLSSYDPKVDKEVKKLIHEARRGFKSFRAEALEKLRGIGEPVFEELAVMLLGSKEYDSDRLDAFSILGQLGQERGIDFLLPILKEDQSAAMRLQAVISLAGIEEIKRTGRVTGPLIDTLRNDDNTDVRYMVAQAFAFFKWDPRVTDALIEALNDDAATTKESLFFGSYEGPSIQDMAAVSLGKIGTEKALDAMVPFVLSKWRLKDALEVFGHIGRPLIGHLIKAQKSADADIRNKATSALEALNQL